MSCFGCVKNAIVSLRKSKYMIRKEIKEIFRLISVENWEIEYDKFQSPVKKDLFVDCYNVHIDNNYVTLTEEERKYIIKLYNNRQEKIKQEQEAAAIKKLGEYLKIS
jgi:hypothetical protein